MDWWFKPGDVVAVYRHGEREKFAVVVNVLKTRVVLDTGERYDHAGNHVCAHKYCNKHITKRWEAICEDADVLAGPVDHCDPFVVVDGPEQTIKHRSPCFQDAFAYAGVHGGRVDWYHEFYIDDVTRERRAARTRVADYA